MTTNPRLPALFLSHGSPMLAIADSPAGRFLDGLGPSLPPPRAIVLASAHFLAPTVHVGADPQPATVHDFGGFSPELHRIHYPASGDPALAEEIVQSLAGAGIPATLAPQHGLDHGVWVPLRRMFPRAQVPVVPISVNPLGDAAAHFALGRALAGLRDAGVLVIGSGGFVHNLGDLDWHAAGPRLAPWAGQFADWMRERLLAGDWAELLAWQERAPHAHRAHPTPEHLLPLFVAMGAGGEQPRVELLHHSHELGTLALDAFAFT
jgi:4,5-DOPA dioxygenase extradiol